MSKIWEKVQMKKLTFSRFSVFISTKILISFVGIFLRILHTVPKQLRNFKEHFFRNTSLCMSCFIGPLALPRGFLWIRVWTSVLPSALLFFQQFLGNYFIRLFLKLYMVLGADMGMLETARFFVKVYLGQKWTKLIKSSP